MADAMLTLVMTDVSGSTRLWAEQPDAMLPVMTRHHAIVHRAIEEHGGWRPIDQGEGDAVFAAFESASAAVQAVLDFQRRLAEEAWPAGIRLEDRVGVHVGEVAVQGGNLFGQPVNRTARIRSLGAPGQVLISAAVHEVVRDALPLGVEVVDLGEHRMKDLDRPERLFQVSVPGVRKEFPPLESLDLHRHNLPVQTTSFVGREEELERLIALVARERLVTVLGFGGMGKTRLALQAAAELVTDPAFRDGVWFVDLAGVEEMPKVPVAIAQAVPAGVDGSWAAVLAWLRERRTLLVLDNLEQLLPAAATSIVGIIQEALGVHVLVTSRVAVRARGEHVFALAPLPVPLKSTGWDDDRLDALSTVPSIALFVARASAARPDFVLSSRVARAVASICLLVEGMPLALELVAARSRVLSPEALLTRLKRGSQLVAGGGADVPARQRTLWSTIAWSVDALPPEIAELLARCSVFPGSFTLEAAEAVAGNTDLDIFDGITELVDRSLLVAVPDTDRFRLLVPIREYVAERLSSDACASLRVRHRRYYRDLVDLGSDWTSERALAVHGILADDWHNVRFAMDSAERAGADDDSVALALAVWLWLMASIRFGEAQAVLEQAQAPARRLGGLWPLQVLLALEAVLEAADRRDAQYLASVDPVGAARLAGDTSLIAWALALRASVAGSAVESVAMLQESHRLIGAMTPRGSAIPPWFVVHEWARLASWYPELRDEVLEFWRAGLRTASASVRGTVLLNVAETLRDAGRPKEALELLEVYERGAVAADEYAQVKLGGPLLAAQCRVDLHDPVTARRDLDLALRVFPDFDAPVMAPMLEFLAAVIDRMLGERDAAATRALGIIDDSAVPLEQRAPAEWLLAVLAREREDTSEAAARLDRAWSGFPRTAIRRAERRACLLEGVEQHVDDHPEHALRLLAFALIDRRTTALGWGVNYEIDAHVERCRSLLGDAAVDDALEAARNSPLPESLRPA